MTRTLILIAVVAVLGVAVTAGLAACRTSGEEGEWKALRKLLGEPGKREPGSSKRRFPFPDDLKREEATRQFAAIRAFAQKYPHSAHLDELIDGFLLPNLWYDVRPAGGGISVSDHGTEYLSLVAWELHSLNPDRRPQFKQELVGRLGELPGSAAQLQRVATAIGDPELARQGAVLEVAEGDEQRRERFRSSVELLRSGAAGEQTPGQQAMAGLLGTFGSPDDALVVEVQGAGQPESVREMVAGGLVGIAARGGLKVDPATKVVTGQTARGRVVVTLHSEVETIPVVVPRATNLETRRERVLAPKYSHGLGRSEHAWQDRQTTVATGGGVTKSSYPLLAADVALVAPDGRVLHSFATQSDWRWDNVNHWVDPITPGCECMDSKVEESGLNLGKRIGFELVGKGFFEKWY